MKTYTADTKSLLTHLESNVTKIQQYLLDNGVEDILEPFRLVEFTVKAHVYHNARCAYMLGIADGMAALRDGTIDAIVDTEFEQSAARFGELPGALYNEVEKTELLLEPMGIKEFAPDTKDVLKVMKANFDIVYQAWVNAGLGKDRKQRNYLYAQFIYHMHLFYNLGAYDAFDATLHSDILVTDPPGKKDRYERLKKQLEQELKKHAEKATAAGE